MDHTLILGVYNLSKEECCDLVEAVTELLKDKHVNAYQVKFGSSVNAGFDDD